MSQAACVADKLAYFVFLLPTIATQPGAEHQSALNGFVAEVLSSGISQPSSVSTVCPVREQQRNGALCVTLADDICILQGQRLFRKWDCNCFIIFIEQIKFAHNFRLFGLLKPSMGGQNTTSPRTSKSVNLMCVPKGKFLATDPEVPGSILGAIIFSEK
jgi:hypothetical protein